MKFHTTDLTVERRELIRITEELQAAVDAAGIGAGRAKRVVIKAMGE